MELYREIILDHYRDPRNQGHVKRADQSGSMVNRSCGDSLTVELQLDAKGRVEDVAHSGSGCAVSQAAASLLTEFVRGKSVKEIEQLAEPDVYGLLGGPVSAARESCALLALRALKEAVANRHD